MSGGKNRIRLPPKAREDSQGRPQGNWGESASGLAGGSREKKGPVPRRLAMKRKRPAKWVLGKFSNSLGHKEKKKCVPKLLQDKEKGECRV